VHRGRIRLPVAQWIPSDAVDCDPPVSKRRLEKGQEVQLPGIERVVGLGDARFDHHETYLEARGIVDETLGVLRSNEAEHAFAPLVTNAPVQIGITEMTAYGDDLAPARSNDEERQTIIT
jgi:hypothetical protein